MKKYIAGLKDGGVINRSIFRLSFPAILSNIALPLLGLCDTYITGHLGDGVYLAAIAVGTVMVNSSYWLFGFLRAGTSGLTAEAYGRRDSVLQRDIFFASLIVGLIIGLLIIGLGRPLSALLLYFVDAPAPTALLARDYFLISTLSAPALLATMSISGWMIGKQNTLYPMVIAISVNVINILISFLLVYVFECGFKGVAYGTMSANWTGLVISLIFARRFWGGELFHSFWKFSGQLDWRKFFKVNTYLMSRSGCIMAVTYGMTVFSSRIGGDVSLATNAVLMQLFLFFSFFMDGYAYAAEAICGKWKGSGEHRMLAASIKWLGVWGGITAFMFSIVYLSGLGLITGVLTDIDAVLTSANRMKWVCAAIPLCSGGAFILDGVYIGLTETRKMFVSTFSAAILFFCIAIVDVYYIHSETYLWLWLAFLLFLLLRSVILTLWLRPQLKIKI